MNWPGLDTIVGAVAGFILAALGVTKLWRDSARNTEAIALEGRERKADITDLRNRTDERLAAVEQKMSARFDGLHACLTGMRDDLCQDRLEASKRYMTKESAKEMEGRIVAAIEKLDGRIEDRFKIAFGDRKGREGR